MLGFLSIFDIYCKAVFSYFANTDINMRNHLLDSPISYYAVYAIARILPLDICRRLGKAIARVVYAFSTKDRSAIAFNLSLALGKPPQDASIKKIIRKQCSTIF